MSLCGYLTGVALMLLVVAPIVWSARIVRRRLVPEWVGPLAWLADTVLFLTQLLLLLQALGTVGLLRRVPIVVACVSVGLTTEAWARHAGWPRVSESPSGMAREHSVRDARYWAGLFAAVAITLAAAPWVLRTWGALHTGVTGSDSMYYHLPFAVDFAQRGSTTSLHFSGYIDETPFDPESSELLHALSMVMFHTDILSPLINLLWFGMAGLAAWCIGRARDAAPATLAAVALLLGGPLLMANDAGQATNDVVDVALILAVVAIAVNSKGRLPAVALAALAAGLGLSNKLSLVVPIAALTLAVVAWTDRRQRWAALRVWLPCMALTGSYWYLRNFLRTGSPLPSVKLGIGPVALPHVDLVLDGTAVAHYLFHRDAWRSIFLPGLHADFGAVWPLTLGLAATGMVVAVLSRDRVLRVLGVAAIVCSVAYVFTPETASGPFVALYFKSNLRFLFPALVVGLVLLPMVPILATRHRQVAVTAALVVMVVATQASYAHDLRPRLALFVYVAAALVLGGLVFAGIGKGFSFSRRTVVFMVMVLLGVGVGAGWSVQGSYFAGRYGGGGDLDTVRPGGRALPALGDLAVYKWADRVTDSRIGFAGFIETYPLYGKDLSNHVQPVGFRGGHGEFLFATSCIEWRRAVNAGHYDYLAIGPVPREVQWTRSDHASQVVLTDKSLATVFRITGPMDPDACGSG